MSPAKAAERQPTARRIKTRARLISAAADVFAERGFHGASVEDLCERADFSRGAFYSNFASKADLGLAMMQEHARETLDRIAAVADRSDLSLDGVVTEVFGVLGRNPAEARQRQLLIRELALHALRDAEFGAAWHRESTAIRTELARLLTRIAHDRGYRFTMPIDVFVVAALAIHDASVADHAVRPRRRAASVERVALPALLAGAIEPVRT